MRGECGAVAACFWVLKNMPRFSTLFFVPPDSETWVVRGMGIESISAFAAVGEEGIPQGLKPRSFWED
jgi:hypothetical protein